MNAISDAELPLAERAYRDLKQAIVHCVFQPNERLRVDELSRRFNISSSPIREALSRLCEQGFVRLFDKKGFRVSTLSIEGIEDLTRIRLLIEAEALADSMRNGDDQWESELVAAAHALSLVERRLGDGPVALDNNWSERHRAFHMTIYSACSSALLLEMVGGLFDRAERYRRYSAQYRSTNRGKNDEHDRILDAVISRDIETAIQYIKQHIELTRDMVVNALRVNGKA